MKFWTNFAKNGKPGISSNGVEWKKYIGQENTPSNYMVLDNRRNLKMNADEFSFYTLVKDLYKEDKISMINKTRIVNQITNLQVLPKRTRKWVIKNQLM